MVLDMLSAASATVAFLEGTTMVAEGHALRGLAARTLGMGGF